MRSERVAAMVQGLSMATDDVDEVALNVLLSDDVSPIVAVAGSTRGRGPRPRLSAYQLLFAAGVFLLLLWLLAF